MDKQVAKFAEVVRADPKLAKGFNAAGLSQGALVVRAYVLLYNDPPVLNLVSIWLVHFVADDSDLFFFHVFIFIYFVY